MENILTFDQFVNEKYGKDSLFIQDNTDMDGFTPYISINTDDYIDMPIASINDLLVGKEYAIKIDCEMHSNLFYQGYIDGHTHMFSSEKLDFRLNFTVPELMDLINADNVFSIKE